MSSYQHLFVLARTFCGGRLARAAVSDGGIMYNEASKKATMKYLDKLKEIRFRVKPEDYERYEEAAKKAGYDSMRQFFIAAIEEKIKSLKI